MTDKTNDTQRGSQYPDTGDNSRVTKDHRALKNQSSVKATDYPDKERASQSLVDKDKDAAGSVVNPAPKGD